MVIFEWNSYSLDFFVVMIIQQDNFLLYNHSKIMFQKFLNVFFTLQLFQISSDLAKLNPIRLAPFMGLFRIR